MSALPVQQPKTLFNPRDSHMIKSYLLGGIAAGGGVGLVTSLLNHLGSINEEAESAARPTDDDTLYLNLRKRPGVKAASMAGSLSLAGGTVGALGSYALVRGLYQRMKKKEVQRQLDAAQQGYIDTLGAEKQAGINPAPVPNAPVPDDGKMMGMTEGMFSAPGAAALILGLTAAGVTNQMLKKTFPVTKAPDRRNPRRVVVRSVDDKMASFDPYDGEELVYRLLMATKSASLHELHDLVHGIALGRRDEIAHGLTTYGLDTAINMVKGAHLNEVSYSQMALACGVAARDPLIGPSLGILAAAEFNEHFPSVVKLASALPEHQDALCRSAEILGAVIRAETCQDFAATLPDGEADKSAGAGMGTIMAADVLNDLLISHMVDKPKPDGQVEMEGDMTNSETTLKGPKTRVSADDPGARQFENQHKDIIDAALAG